MEKVIAYTRVSTDAQVGEDKFGLEAQKEQIKAYCAEHDMKILRWYTDEGESGAKYRPGFDEIVYGEVAKPPVESVIVAKSDRVARDINIYFYYKAMLLRKGMKLISISEDFGQFGQFSSILEAFIIIFAEMERDNITKRMSGGRYVKSLQGGYSGGKAPFGYCVDKATHRLVVCPEEIAIVKAIFELKDNAHKSYRDISAILASRGMKTRSGGVFQAATLRGIYDNRKFYEGYYRYGKGAEWVRGAHEPLFIGGEA